VRSEEVLMGFGKIGKNEDNMLENPNFGVWFFLGKGGLVVGGKEEMDI